MGRKWTPIRYAVAMKIGTLQAIGHNIADSVASGIGLMIGVYSMDIFSEASSTPEGYIEVDFLTGTTSGGRPSAGLASALKLYSEEALPQLCERHGVAVSDFRKLDVRFWRGTLNGRFEVTVEDKLARVSRAEYEGSPGKRVKVLDHLGRLRPK
jgi:hypothetical protein